MFLNVAINDGAETIFKNQCSLNSSRNQVLLVVHFINGSLEIFIELNFSLPLENHSTTTPETEWKKD